MNAQIEPELVLDGSKPVPSLLREQLAELIVGGALHPGEELPTVRAVAVGLGIPPSVVQEAYDELAGDGLLDPVEGAGPRVLASVSNEPHDRSSELTILCHEFLSRTLASGFTPIHVMHMLRTLTEREVCHE